MFDHVKSDDYENSPVKNKKNEDGLCFGISHIQS